MAPVPPASVQTVYGRTSVAKSGGLLLMSLPLQHQCANVLAQQINLNFSQEQVAFVLGYSLRSLYDDVIAADMPEHLKALVLKLEEKYPP
jgi:hypothetical protein